MGGYGSKNRRKSRAAVVTVAVVFLVGLGLLFSHLGKQKIAREEFFASAGRAILSGDYVPMRDTVKTLGQQLADDDRAPGALLGLDVRAELAVSLLYTGSQRQRERATELLVSAK